MEKQTPREKVNKLDDLNIDLETYIANTIIPQLYVDDNLILRKFTLPAIDQFNLTPDDFNKNIQEISDKINYPTLVENIKEVIKTGNKLEKEIQTSDKRWFQMNILPYVVKKEKRTDGVMITLIDINKRIAVANELEQLKTQRYTLLNKLSHNLKQPISNIGLLADELVDAFDKKDTEQFTTWIEILRGASGKMNKIIKDFTNHF
ncbi:PAS domain-containing protein [Algoriphagus antarcticus]|uniref:PAS domain-containing protein n=1 Tax=Algoriphagus antarcticus TaxID=238540 RepID=A0A3E0E3M0_9BACT|nr:PAS domain-containing protein [Algoriphagus antarcticus]REG92791.1 PAS domain-containing protein [Algoriphagus antarcticus]